MPAHMCTHMHPCRPSWTAVHASSHPHTCTHVHTPTCPIYVYLYEQIHACAPSVPPPRLVCVLYLSSSVHTQIHIAHVSPHMCTYTQTRTLAYVTMTTHTHIHRAKSEGAWKACLRPSESLSWFSEQNERPLTPSVGAVALRNEEGMWVRQPTLTLSRVTWVFCTSASVICQKGE